MYTIEQSLDGILIKLKENWNNSGGRKYLSCEDVLTEFGFPPDYRKHEFFIRLIDKLVKDGYAEIIEAQTFQIFSKIALYQENTIITVEGYYFITDPHGGYVNVDELERLKNLDKRRYENRLLYGTWAVAIGAVALVVWEMLKTFVFEHHYWCDF